MSGKEALNRAAKEFSETTKSEGMSVLNDVQNGILSKDIGAFISKFIHVFLEVFYDADEKPRQIEAVVSTLVREPLITGIEQLRVANKTVPFSEKSMRYRIERFQNALCSLDRARSLASEEFEIALIDLLRGLCALEIPGGESEALVHLSSFEVWGHRKVEEISSVKEEKQLKAERLDVEIQELKHSLEDLKVSDVPLYLAFRQAQNRAQSLRAEIDEITQHEGKVMHTSFYISALLRVAQKIAEERV
jgi:hypothetical protein